MSKYTTELRFICENLAGLDESAGYNSVNNIIAAARPRIFDFTYPIFDNTYKSVLESKILKHYYLREIAHESVGIWRLRLDATMNEIMPYYNQLYNSELIEFNPMWDVDLTTDHDKDNTGRHVTDDDRTHSNTYTHTNTNVVDRDDVEHTDDVIDETTDRDYSTEEWNKYSDTPQGGVNGLASDTYLTDARHINTTGSEDIDKDTNRDIDKTLSSDITTTDNARDTDTSSDTIDITNTITDTEEYLEHIKGHRAGVSFSKYLNEFRETFLNIDKQVINELEPLFFGLW